MKLLAEVVRLLRERQQQQVPLRQVPVTKQHSSKHPIQIERHSITEQGELYHLHTVIPMPYFQIPSNPDWLKIPPFKHWLYLAQHGTDSICKDIFF